MDLNMGLDYATLARLSQNNGIVAGGNPAGNIGTAAQAGYQGQEQGEHQAFMQKASQLAEMDQQLKSQQLGEYQAGAPGRMATIGVQNALAGNQQANLPDLLSANTDETKTKSLDAKMKLIQAEFEKAAPYASAWSNTKDPGVREMIKQKMKEDGITKIGKHDLDTMSDEELDHFMIAARTNAVHTVGQEQKEDQIAAQGKAWVDRMNAAGDKRIEQENIKQKGALERQKMAVEARKQAALIAASKPENTSQYEAEMQKKLAKWTDSGDDSDMTEGERTTYMMYLKNKLANSAARAANTAPTLDPNALPPGMLRPPSVPGPQPFPTPQSRVDPKAATLLSTYQQRVKANPASKASESAALLGSSAFKSLDPQTQEQVKKLING
jgi:hypothetical protein